MTKPHLALLDPKADDEEIDGFLAALGVTPGERGVAQDYIKGAHGYFEGARPKGGAHQSSEALQAKAKEVFGVTDDIHETGYITPDGTMLDFSGRHYATGYHREGDHFVPDKLQPDYLAGQRNVDHRELIELFPDDLSGQGNEGRMHTLVNAGFIRTSPNSGTGSPQAPEGSLGLEIHRPMTPPQIRTALAGARSFETLGIDVVDDQGQSVSVHDNWGVVGKSIASVIAEAQASAKDPEPIPRASVDDIELFHLRFRAAQKDEDDHYYGAWIGGKKSQGGHPAYGYTGPAKAQSQVSHGQGVGGEAPHATPGQLAEFEAAILKKDPKIEWGMVYDKEGQPVYAQPVRGNSSYIRWALSPSLKVQWQGGTLTHNHPYGGVAATLPTTLSVTDVINGLHNGLRSTRAFSPTGSMELINHGFTGNINMLRERLDAGVRDLKKAIPKDMKTSAEVDAANVAWLTGHRDLIIRVIGDTPGLEIVTTP